jgi:predicted NAD/FAD-binding protein
MASAIWSTSLNKIEQFPAVTLLRFFDHHGLLRLTFQPKWRVIRGGSRQYIPPITAPYRDRISTESKIAAVERGLQGVNLKFADRPAMSFDDVVFACHGDQVLPLLESPTEPERAVLGSFTTSRNEASLHRDSSLLPRRRSARASWNYSIHSGGGNRVTVTYHMNRLQSLPTREDYCVTLNGGEWIDPENVIYSTSYHHPLYTQDAVSASARWREISGKNCTHFCGAYWFNGFHEDGLNSALRVARTLEVDTDAA